MSETYEERAQVAENKLRLLEAALRDALYYVEHYAENQILTSLANEANRLVDQIRELI